MLGLAEFLVNGKLHSFADLKRIILPQLLSKKTLNIKTSNNNHTVTE